jgi:hypothetical protein
MKHSRYVSARVQKQQYQEVIMLSNCTDTLTLPRCIGIQPKPSLIASADHHEHGGLLHTTRNSHCLHHCVLHKNIVSVGDGYDVFVQTVYFVWADPE